MNKLMYIILSIAFILNACSTHSYDRKQSIVSPDKKINVSFWIDNGKPFYSIEYFGKPVILPSPLGFVLKDNDTLTNNLKLVQSTFKHYDENWEQPWGDQRIVRENYNEKTFDLIENSNRRLQIVFRVFDDGVGFRYNIPDQEGIDSIFIIDELTEFRMANDHQAWWIPAYKDNRYEYLYQRSALSSLDTVHTPLTMETVDGPVITIHEAALVNYAGMTLASLENNTLKCDLAPWSDGTKVKTSTPLQTPWRSVLIEQNAGGLITSKLILNLNEPNKLEDISWIEPNKYLGIWWGMHIGKYSFWEGENHGATTSISKEYIDNCNELGIDHLLIEGWNIGWTPAWYENRLHVFSFTESTPDFNFSEVAEYAKNNNVKLIGYHETGSNIDNYIAQIDAGMQMYKDGGMNDVKIGQVGSKLMMKEWHYGQYGVNYYKNVLDKAADYNLTVNFHEPVKPTGLHRTYPHLMAGEGARGQEYNAWSEGNPPEHTVILPFTRLLGGPMDFTPGIFDISSTRVHTTLAKQLALYLTFYSPIQMLADLPENYVGHPAFEFLKDVPVNWDTTVVLNAKIGDYFTVARKDRDSEDWFLGSITDENNRDFEIDLSFLEEGKKYTAEIYADAENAEFDKNPEAYSINDIEVTSKSKLNIKLAKGGGQAIHFNLMN
jgi:alpha-glucosidase